MEKLTTLFKALADPNRLRIVHALLQSGELCACQLTELIGVTGATASRHLGILISAGLVTSRKEGRWVHYRICRERAESADLIVWIERQLQNDSEADLDSITLKRIIACGPEELCRVKSERQGEK